MKSVTTVVVVMLAWLLTACAMAPSVEPSALPEKASQPAATESPMAEDDPGETTEQPTSTPVASAVETVEDPVAPTLAASLGAAFPAAPMAEGEVVLVTGRVMDVDGAPIADAAVEFWQTDGNGVYDHPGDSATAQRDPRFQFYGTSLTDADGRYDFRTIVPGYYEPRPRHIHVKVKFDGATLLTSQFYFEEDRDGLTDAALILAEMGRVEFDGTPVRILAKDLVIDTGSSAGSMPLTPAQGEGPYYPLVNVADYDNDLTVIP